MKKHEGLIAFIRRFPDDEACKKYLSDQKWASGFQCRRCGHEESGKGETAHHRRCKNCRYDESPTAHTLFHKIKFPLQKAFVIIHQLTTMKKGMSSCEISRQYGIHQETAWTFKQKVMRAMAVDPCVLSGSVEIDETVVGGHEKGKPGRSHGRRKSVQVAAEIEYPEEEGNPVIKRARSLPIHGYAASDMAPAINQMVDDTALVTTDGNLAYPKALGKRDHLVFLSENGANFQLLHWHIFNLKNWIRGTHHKVSGKHIRYYLEEFHFRFNYRNFIQRAFNSVVKNMLNLPWMPYKQLIAA